MFKAYKYRIYPTDSQKELINKTFGCCRLVYNIALQTKITAYKEACINLSSYDLMKQLTDMKSEYKWLNEVDSQALQVVITNMDTAFKAFFKGGGYPKFKNKNSRQSFICKSNTRKLDWDKSTISIPKIYDIPVSLSRKFSGEVKRIAISRTGTGKYFASVLVDNGIELPQKKKVHTDTAVGIDLGIKTFAVLSNGGEISNPKYFKNSLQRLKCLQRRANRKKKGSNNRKKANIQVSILHEKITNQRQDFLHKFSDAITKQYDTICVENLNVAGMKKNHNLAQSISDVGWSAGLQFIKYKSEWRGKNYIEIGRFEPSSKIHNKCGYKNEILTLADREWYCPICNEMVSRDLNAAENIRDFGLKKHSGERISGESVELSALVGTKKQKNIL